MKFGVVGTRAMPIQQLQKEFVIHSVGQKRLQSYLVVLIV